MQHHQTILRLLSSADTASTWWQVREFFVQPRIVAIYFSLQNIETSSGSHQASYLLDTGCSFPSSIATRMWSWQLASNVEVKNFPPPHPYRRTILRLLFFRSRLDLALEFSAHCTLRKCGDSNGYPLCYMFLAKVLGSIWFPQDHTAC